VGRLFWKILLAFWLTLIATVAATAGVIWALREERAGAEPTVALGLPAVLATDLAAATLRHGGVDALRDWMGEVPRPRGLAVYAVDARGADILGRPVPEAALAGARELAGSGEARRAVREVETPGGERYLLFAQLQGEPRGPHLLGGGRRGPGPAPWLMFAMGAVASLAVSAVLAWYLARPIRSLRWALRAAAEGKLETRVRPLMKGRRDEIADLGEEFDEMARQLQKLVEAQRRLLHDVSHELRSPLARLQAAVGLARQDPRRLEASLERIEREVARLDELVGEVLALARLEGGKPASREELVDLAEVVANVVDDARFEAQAANRSLSFECADRVVVRGRAELLQRAVENVVRNAVKYTSEGSTVEVKLSAAGERARLVVRDYGPGVAPGDAGRIFEAFYRSRSDASIDGFGLGLAIAQAAIVTHHGSIRADNADGGGLRIEIELPLELPAGNGLPT
jgi:two-component system OmpR family sensor kinase